MMNMSVMIMTAANDDKNLDNSQQHFSLEVVTTMWSSETKMC